MVPGTALGVLVMIWRSSSLPSGWPNTGDDVTAMPLGLDTPSTFGIILFILGLYLQGLGMQLSEQKVPTAWHIVLKRPGGGQIAMTVELTTRNSLYGLSVPLRYCLVDQLHSLLYIFEHLHLQHRPAIMLPVVDSSWRTRALSIVDAVLFSCRAI